MKYLVFICSTFLCLESFAQSFAEDSAYIRDHYIKKETRIVMRDGVKLFTSIYIPKDTSQQYPFLLQRTPYSIAPYGEDNYSMGLGPNPLFLRDQYIFVYQDVRERHMSEGQFKEMTP